MAAFQGGLLPAEIKAPVQTEAAGKPGADHQPEGVFDALGRAAVDFRAGKGFDIVLDMHRPPEPGREVCGHRPAVDTGNIGGDGATLPVQNAAQADTDRALLAGFLIGLLHGGRHGVEKPGIVPGRCGPPPGVL